MAYTLRQLNHYLFFALCFTLCFAFSFSIPVSAQNLGRLFFTPAERADMDRMRAKYKPGEKIPEITKEEMIVEESEAPKQLVVNGFVKRSSGNNTTWINQEPRLVSNNSQNIIVQQKMAQAPKVSVSLPTGKRLKLKAGQSVDLETGKVREVYDEDGNSLKASKTNNN